MSGISKRIMALLLALTFLLTAAPLSLAEDGTAAEVTETEAVSAKESEEPGAAYTTEPYPLKLSDGYDIALVWKKILRADANRDGNVNAADARAVLRLSASLIPESEVDVSVSDLDADGRITSADARLLLRYSAGLDEYFLYGETVPEFVPEGVYKTADGKDIVYFGRNGVMLKNGEAEIDGETLYFGADGRLAEGLVTRSAKTYYYHKGKLVCLPDGDDKTILESAYIDGKRIYYCTDGSVADGLLTFGSRLWYFENGVPYQGWMKRDGNTYYFGPAMKTGVVFIDDVRYYFGEDGAMRTGWKYYDNSWFYFDPVTGEAAIGWKEIDSKTYRFTLGGRMKTGWYDLDGKRYYFDSDGTMHSGWLEYDGRWYYFGSDGAALKGLQTIDSKKYYFNEAGQMKSGWVRLNGRYYYFGSDGAMKKSAWVKDNGSWYYMGSDGAMKTGWLKLSSGKYYLNSSGVMQTGWQQISGEWYYFASSGKMLTGKQTVNGKIYDFGKDGASVSGRTGLTPKIAMIGDSLVSNIYYCRTSKAVDFWGKPCAHVNNLNSYTAAGGSRGGILNEITNQGYDIIVILVGVNDVYMWSDAEYVGMYRDLIKEVRRRAPGAIVYGMSILPVNEARERANGYSTANYRVQRKNASIKTACEKEGCGYLDAWEVLADSHGSLPYSFASDGIHLTAAANIELVDWMLKKIK